MKKYYSFEDALDFLNASQRCKYRMHDLQDMIARQIIHPCFYYKGNISKASLITDKGVTMMHIKELFVFSGYLDLGARVLRDGKLIQPPFFIKEAIQIISPYNPYEPPKYSRSEVTKSGDPVFFIVQTDALLDMPATKDCEQILPYKSDLFGINISLDQIFISVDELEKIVCLQQAEQPTLTTQPATPDEPITTLQAIGIMAELLALEDGCYKYRKGESNVNAKAISVAVSNRAKARFGDDIRGFESFNKKISEGLKALEKIEKK